MNSLLVSVLILVIGLGLLALFTKWYSDFWFKVLVSNKAELVNEILASEELPGQWRLPFLERIANQGEPDSLFQRLKPLLKRWYLYRLSRLIHSVWQATTIKKDLKAEYMAGLQEIYDEWQARQDLF